jgi:hypothetical protein
VSLLESGSGRILPDPIREHARRRGPARLLHFRSKQLEEGAHGERRVRFEQVSPEATIGDVTDETGPAQHCKVMAYERLPEPGTLDQLVHGTRSQAKLLEKLTSPGIPECSRHATERFHSRRQPEITIQRRSRLLAIVHRSVPGRPWESKSLCVVF